MKMLVLFIALCIATFPFIEGNEKSMRKSQPNKCCHEMSKDLPYTHNKGNQCDPAACPNMLNCVSISFLKPAIFKNVGLFNVSIKKAFVPEFIGELSQY